MKKYNLLWAILAVFLLSCEDTKNDTDPTVDPEEDYVAINEWIYEDMNHYYYWYKDMPTPDAGSYSNAPDEFFSAVLSSKDKFSYLEHDGQAVTRATPAVVYDYGFEFLAYRVSEAANSPVVFWVAYVKTGSLADGKLKRGDLITAINGTNLTASNAIQLLNAYTNPTFTLFYDNNNTVEVSYTPNFEENPILYSDIIEYANKKIGYIVYNFFASAPDNDGMVWSLEMNDILKKFQEESIDELILDLRYNSGGYVHSGTYIASAIAPNRSGKVYTQRSYNDKLEKESYYKNSKINKFYDVITEDRITYNIPQLELNRLFVLTSSATASASEQIINGLRAYMEVEIIGQKTVGKNMESFELKDTGNNTHTWKLHPLTSVSYNSKVTNPADNDYSDGFYPTIAISKDDADEVNRVVWYRDSNNNVLPAAITKKQLGDKEETLLSIALNFISTGDRVQGSKAVSRSNTAFTATPMPMKTQKIHGAIVVQE